MNTACWRGLNLHGRRCGERFRGVFGRRARLVDQRAYQVLVRLAHHPGDALQTSHLTRRALSVAARDQNATVRIASMDATHELAHFRIRRGRDGAGVQDRHLAFVDTRGFLKPGLKQLLLQRRAIGLAGATAEIDDVKRRHAQKRNCS